MRETLLALGLLLSIASGFRPGHLPVGPGEVALALWVLLETLRHLHGRGPRVTPALRWILVFWIVFASAEAVGTLTGVAIGDRHDHTLFMHDVIAYVFVAAIAYLSVAGDDAAARLRRIAWKLAGLGSGFLALQLGAALGLIHIPGMEPWFGDRLRGWSENPNQLAFCCAALALLAVHLADAAERPVERLAALASAILPIWVGRLTKTDTFSYVLVAAVPIYLALKSRDWLRRSAKVTNVRRAAAGVIVVGVPLLLASMLPLMLDDSAQAGQLALGLTKNGGAEARSEADLRLQLWGEAIDRGIESMGLGLGPGPHLPIPPSIVAARLTSDDTVDQHPQLSAVPNFEAHNTILDLLTQGGLVASAAFVWLVVLAIRTAQKARLAGLATLACGLALFGLTSLIVRQPVFWFAIVLCLTAVGTDHRSRELI